MVMDQIEHTIQDTASKDEWLRENPPKIEWFGWKARPHELDPNHPFVKVLESNIKKFTEEIPIYTGGSAGLDARLFVHHGTPAISFGPYGEKIHSTDERVSISSTLKTTEIIISTIIDWCGVE